MTADADADAQSIEDAAQRMAAAAPLPTEAQARRLAVLFGAATAHRESLEASA